MCNIVSLIIYIYIYVWGTCARLPLIILAHLSATEVVSQIHINYWSSKQNLCHVSGKRSKAYSEKFRQCNTVKLRTFNMGTTLRQSMLWTETLPPRVQCWQYLNPVTKNTSKIISGLRELHLVFHYRLRVFTLFPGKCLSYVLKAATTTSPHKGKAVPLQAWSGPEGSRKLRFPHFMTKAQDGGKVVSLTHRPPLPPGNAPATQFC